MTHEIEKAKQVKLKYEKDWLKVADVTAIGIGKISSGKMGIIISLKKDSAKARQQIPRQIDGVAIDVKISGEIKAL